MSLGSTVSLSCTTMVSGLAQAVAGVAVNLVGGQLAPSQNNVQLSACTATNNALTLPNNMANGSVVTIRNDGLFFCQVFPYSGGAIDGNTADFEAYVAQLGGIKSFVNIGSNTWLTMSANAVKPVFAYTAANTITGAAHGTLSRAHTNGLIKLAAAAGAVVALPAVATSSGIVYDFVTFVVGQTHTITPATAVLNGCLLNAPVAAATGLTKANGANYTHSATSILGDKSSVTSDATNWYCSGAGFAAAAFA